MSKRADEPMINQQKHIARPSSLYDSIVSVAVVPSWIRHIKESSTLTYMLMANSLFKDICILRNFVFYNMVLNIYISFRLLHFTYCSSSSK